MLGSASTLDRLVDTTDVRIDAFALLNVSLDHRLGFSGSSGPVVHFVLAGSGLFEFEDVPAIPVSAGDIVVIPPACRKTIRTGTGPVGEVWLGDRCKMSLAGLVQVDAGPGPPVLTIACGSVGADVVGNGLLDGLTQPIREDLPAYPFAVAAFEQLRREFTTPAFATHALAGALMKACLALVIREHLDRLLALGGFPPQLGQLRLALTHVIDRPGLPHSVVSLGVVAGMSRTSFARAFTAAFETSPMDFVTRVRLHHAAKLLITTNLSIKVIAASVGLSRSHFSRSFHARYGRDPHSFRSAAEGGRAQ